MQTEIIQSVIEHAVGTFFALLQIGFVAAMSGLVKMYWDVRQLKRDVDAAHKKLRELT